MRLETDIKDDAIHHLESAIFLLDAYTDAKLINMVCKLKSVLFILKRDL